MRLIARITRDAIIFGSMVLSKLGPGKKTKFEIYKSNLYFIKIIKTWFIRRSRLIVSNFDHEPQVYILKRINISSSETSNKTLSPLRFQFFFLQRQKLYLIWQKGVTHNRDLGTIGSIWSKEHKNDDKWDHLNKRRIPQNIFSFFLIYRCLWHAFFFISFPKFVFGGYTFLLDECWVFLSEYSLLLSPF